MIHTLLFMFFDWEKTYLIIKEKGYSDVELKIGTK